MSDNIKNPESEEQKQKTPDKFADELLFLSLTSDFLGSKAFKDSVLAKGSLIRAGLGLLPDLKLEHESKTDSGNDKPPGADSAKDRDSVTSSPVHTMNQDDTKSPPRIEAITEPANTARKRAGGNAGGMSPPDAPEAPPIEIPEYIINGIALGLARGRVDDVSGNLPESPKIPGLKEMLEAKDKPLRESPWEQLVVDCMMFAYQVQNSKLQAKEKK